MTTKLIGPRTAQFPARHTADFAPMPERGPVPEARQPSVVSQIWDMLRRRKWTVLAALVSVVAVAAVVTNRLPRSYTSNATILVGSGPRDAGLPNDIISQGPDIQTEIKLIGSRRITEPVVDEYDLHVLVLSPAGKGPRDVLQGFDATPEAVPGIYTLKPVSGGYELHRPEPDSLLARLAPGQPYADRGLRFQAPAEPGDEITLQVMPFGGAVGMVMGSVSASLVDPEATLFLLSCGASRAEDAQHICDGLSKSYVALRNELLRSDAVHSAQFLEEQSQSVGAQLAEAEDELRRYKESNDGLEPQNLASMQSQEVAQFQAQRDQLEAERVALAGAIAGLDHGKGTQAYRDLASYPTFIRNPMVGDILNNLMTYENELHELQQRRTDTNIDVVNLRQRISELEQQLGRLATTYETALRGQIASLDQAAGRARGRLTAVPRQQMEVARLERESELLTQLYNTIQQKLKEAEIAKAVTLADVSIIDPSTLPTRPSSPDVRLNMILAVFGGLILGLLGALVQEFADTRVRRRYEVEQETGLPVLTMIPSVKGGRLVVGRSPKLLKGTASASKGGGLADYYPVGGELVVEAFRSLGADLDVMAGATPGRESTTAVFTSPSRGEGKTFNAVNFAATRAMEGYRTLLIDADLRSGAAGAALGLGQDAGLSDILSGEARLLDVVRMVKVANHRLAVLGAGSAPRDPSRLLGSEELDRILADAARHFQQVVIDTPPMNLVSDAALFAARADAVFIVVRSGQTDREALEMALNRLDRLGARALGIVLNDVKPTGEYVSSVYEPAAQAAAS